MIISSEITRSVVFVGYQKADGRFVYCGTAFYYLQSSTNNFYLVTARHIIDGINNLGINRIFLRINLKNGTATHFKSARENWFVDPANASIDVAIIKTQILDEFDHVALSDAMCVTDGILIDREVGLGDEVSIIGLFRHHHGIVKNIPIVRTGNLASMLVQQIVTRIGEIEAYLIEARSIGGLSGSPVFLNLGTVRLIRGEIKTSTEGKAIHHLLGLIHGHFDVKVAEIDHSSIDDGLSMDKVNTGIAIVTPANKIQELILMYENSIKM